VTRGKFKLPGVFERRKEASTSGSLAVKEPYKVKVADRGTLFFSEE